MQGFEKTHAVEFSGQISQIFRRCFVKTFQQYDPLLFLDLTENGFALHPGIDGKNVAELFHLFGFDVDPVNGKIVFVETAGKHPAVAAVNRTPKRRIDTFFGVVVGIEGRGGDIGNAGKKDNKRDKNNGKDRQDLPGVVVGSEL